MNIFKIGIMGVGFVGGAMAKYFKKQRVKLFLYDKYKHLGSIAEVNKAEIIFICVPTPYLPHKGFELSFVEDALNSILPGKIVVIKSSILPGTTEFLQKKYSKLRIIFNPEFLREISAYEDFISPDRQILGITKKSKSVSARVMKILPRAPYEQFMKADEAEMIKYMANAFLALKVVYANQFADLCKKLKIKYSVVANGVGLDKRIGLSHLNVLDGGYKGYGGSCFPKDVNAIIELAQAKKLSFDLLVTMRKINQKYLQQSGLTEEYFLNNLHKSNEKK